MAPLTHDPEGRHADRRGGRLRAARVAWTTFLVAVMVVVVSFVYLRPFLDDPARFPHGVDTPGYLQRSQLVFENGLNALTPFGERPAHPIVTSILHDVTGGALLDLGRVWPAIFAVAIALAGAALGAGVAAERRWVGAALGAGLAASPFVALTAIGYAPNLLVDVLAVAAVALAVRVRSGGPGVVGLVLLLAAAAIAHWLFAFLLIALLGGYAAAVALATWLRRRESPGWRDPRRLLLAVGLGAVLGAILLIVSPERPDRVPTGAKNDTSAKIEARLPEMALGLTIPLAAAGAAVMWASRRPATRRVLPPLAMWAAVAPAGLIAWKAFGVAVPYRIVPFALGVPIVIVLGAAATRSWTDAMASRPERRGWVRAGAAASAILVLGAATWLTVRGAGTWIEPKAAFTPEQYEQAATLAAYLETAPANTRIVVPMAPGVFRPIRALMVTLPVDRYLDVKVWRVNFFGDRALFLERLDRKFPGAIAAYLAGYSAQPPLGGTRLGAGVDLLAGPKPGGALTPRPATPSEDGELIRLTVGSLATLAVVGLGWAILLTGFPAFAAVCISPAIGVAMLSLGGFVAGRLGFPLGRGGGVLVALGVALVGWLGVLGASRRASSEPSIEPELGSPAPVVPRKGGRHLAGQHGVRDE